MISPDGSGILFYVSSSILFRFSIHSCPEFRDGTLEVTALAYAVAGETKCIENGKKDIADSGKQLLKSTIKMWITSGIKCVVLFGQQKY